MKIENTISIFETNICFFLCTVNSFQSTVYTANLCFAFPNIRTSFHQKLQSVTTIYNIESTNIIFKSIESRPQLPIKYTYSILYNTDKKNGTELLFRIQCSHFTLKLLFGMMMIILHHESVIPFSNCTSRSTSKMRLEK